jgi:hypothetical protein
MSPTVSQCDGSLSPVNVPSIALQGSRQVVLKVRTLLYVLNCSFIYDLHIVYISSEHELNALLKLLRESCRFVKS